MSVGVRQMDHTNKSDGIKTIIINDFPRSTRVYFAPEKKTGQETHEVVARQGEPLTYYSVKDTDRKLNCVAEEGALILVLPNNLPHGTHLDLERMDDALNHMVTVQSEAGNIDGYEKVSLRPKNAGADKYSKMSLTKSSKDKSSNNWSIV